MALTSDKIDFRAKIVTRDREGYFLGVKRVNSSRKYNVYNLTTELQNI